VGVSFVSSELQLTIYDEEQDGADEPAVAIAWSTGPAFEMRAMRLVVTPVPASAHQISTSFEFGQNAKRTVANRRNERGCR
jgi:hypothetical protein